MNINEQIIDILHSVVKYADGQNPEQRNFFQEMDNDPNFQKAFKEYDTKKKQQGLSDQEIVQAQLINLMVDDDVFQMSSGEHKYYDEDMLFSSAILRQAGMSPAARVIKQHRRLQLLEFGRFSANKETTGFRLVHKDPDYQPTKNEADDMKKWGDIIANKFFFLNGSTKPNLGEVLGAAYEDFFDLGRMAFFNWRKKNGNPLGMILLDSALVKPIVPKRFWGMQRYDQDDWKVLSNESGIKDANDFYADDYRFLLINKYQTRIAKFTEKELNVYYFFKRSATADLFRGNGIIFQAISLLTNIINAIEWNASQATNNRIPQGMIALEGGANVNPIQVEKFKKLLWAQSQGPSNRWRVPIIALPEKNQIQWINFKDSSNKDMMFFEWIGLLYTMFCRLSGTDPEEVSMASNRGTMEGKGALFQQGSEGVTRRSKDTGLRTFLTTFSEYVNDSGIIRQLTGMPEWIGTFSGLDAKDESLQADLRKKLLETTATVNELLSQDGKKKFKFEIGGINPFDVPGVMNQQIFQLVQLKMQQGIQQEMGGQPGEEGAPGEGEAPEEMQQGGEAPEEEEALDEEVEKAASGLFKSIQKLNEIEIEFEA